MPCNERPRSKTPKVEVGAPVQIADPMSTITMVMWIVTCRPKISAIWAQKGRKAAEVKLNAEIIQLSWLTSSGSVGVSRKRGFWR